MYSESILELSNISFGGRLRCTKKLQKWFVNQIVADGGGRHHQIFFKQNGVDKRSIQYDVPVIGNEEIGFPGFQIVKTFGEKPFRTSLDYLPDGVINYFGLKIADGMTVV
jgi:riboflavin biosynthesis pyrimidine reductase